MKRFLPVLLSCCFSTAFPQTNYNLLLKSGITTPAHNWETARTVSPAPNESIGGYYFKYIQFLRIPLQKEREAMESLGIRFLDYIPHKAYVTAIPQNFDLRRLAPYGIRAVVDILPAYKTDPSIAESPLPSWTLTGNGEIDVAIRYYSILPEPLIRTKIEEMGFPVLRSYSAGSWMDVRIPVSKIEFLASQPYISSVEPVPHPSTPDDQEGRSLHRSNVINSGFPGFRKYDGTGVTAALGDDGQVGPHIDFQGRVDQSNSSGFGGTHGDMTAGILMGGGNLDPTIAGMGTGVFLYVYDIGPYNHITDVPVTKTTYGVRVTSTSYSQVCGGIYNNDARTGDQMIRQNPEIMHVFSCGNSAGSNCGYGAGTGWGTITGGYKAGKNVIATGNLDNLDVRDPSSSMGPADDGRIKPDICSNGRDQMSTDPNNAYAPGGGTSAAAPGIAGIFCQLIHAYRDLNSGADPQSPLIKACLLNTAEDLGNPGPDFTYGWGRVNALRALRTLEDYRYTDSVVTQGDTVIHSFSVPAGTRQLRVMLYWLDYEGSTSAARALVNDLRFTVTDPAAVVFNPWVLDPTPNAVNLDSDATRGIDTLNNMEQVTIDFPAPGNYTLTVDGFEVPQGPQRYYIVYELVTDDIEVTYPVGGEGFVPGETEILRWDAPEDPINPFLLQYTADNGSSWNLIDTVAANQLYFSWAVPAIVTGNARIRVARGAEMDVSDTTFSIIRLPSNIWVPMVCPDSFLVVWDSVPGATGYEVYMLGAKYMDPVGTVFTNSAMVAAPPTKEKWISVAALGPGIRGRRANAVYKAPGTSNCSLAYDAELVKLISPGSGTYFNCLDLSILPVTIEVTNQGVNPLTNIPVNMKLDTGTVISDVIPGPVAPGGSIIFTFSSTIDLSALGSHGFNAWITFAGDGNKYNDSTGLGIDVFTGVTGAIPWTEDLETFTLCGILNDCGATTCNLGNGMVNETNGEGDDIDWRTDENGTATGQTGPTIDHNPGTIAGNYIYLEPSGGCDGMTANLITPCFDLTSTIAPQLSFWYHMYGLEMGELHVDVIDGGEVDEDVVTPVSGNQGDVWRRMDVNLTAYNGKTVNVRIRGVTGTGYRSDLALDDFMLYDYAYPPDGEFTVDNINPCVDEVINFTDLSVNDPTGWYWTISPANYTFAGGTTLLDQNISVQFTASGTYDVTLVVSNPVGQDTITKVAYIDAGKGLIPPVAEDFEFTMPPAGWRINAAGGTHTWDTIAGVTGAAGVSTTAAWVNNFNYVSSSNEDELVTRMIDLYQVLNPKLIFDRSYARRTGAMNDGLIVSISADCGNTWSEVYNKSGTSLETAPSTASEWFPQNAGDWDEDTVDLAAWISDLIVVRFTNVNFNGNNLFLDNVNVEGIFTGIPDPSVQTGVYVLPNPSDGKIMVRFPGVGDLEVIDLLGRTVFSAPLAGNAAKEIDLSALAPGAYYLVLKQGAFKSVSRISLY